MSDTLKPAADLADAMEKPAQDASDDYLAARRELLVAEIELRRQMEAVAAQRRALPPGPVVEDWELEGATGKVRLSELFDGASSLLVYCYMFPRHAQDDRPGAAVGEIADLPLAEQPCPSCTALLDQLDGAVPHFTAGGGRFVVVAGTSPPRLAAMARERGWRNLHLLSSLGSGFKRRFHAEDRDGQQEPMTLVFQRGSDGTIRLAWASELVWAESDPGQDHRAAGTIEPFWNMFDLIPGGRPKGFHEQLRYDCCGGAT